MDPWARPGQALSRDADALDAQFALALGNLDSDVAVLLDPAAQALLTPASELAAARRILDHAQTLFTMAAMMAARA